ncbi:C-type lectin domain family 17, member a [Plakobranchus ocellatus]|uniref:C-type lectin domain family 17, member a n=1 Tax=Plakobranchus ocellatus TaxID=259542 RepID=A0AAV3ZRA8_9GAST|nr:C-type lectin domain family 17, member a [Plakobranchus ocellatus]
MFWALLLFPLSAIAISDECFEARKTCYDQWERNFYQEEENCAACEDFMDCASEAKRSGVCPNDTVIVEEVHLASQRCHTIGYGLGPYSFPDLGESHKQYTRLTSFDMLYEFVSDKDAKYEEASDFCSQAGGSLYIVRNRVYFNSLKNNLLSQISNVDRFWIGLNDKAKEGEYRFEDGSTMKWNFFAQNEGTHDTDIFGFFRRGGEDCVSMDMEGEGFVEDCNKKYKFICQYRGIPSSFIG